MTARASSDLLGDYRALQIAYTREQEKTRQLEEALESNRIIGIAIGILMVSRGLTRDQAFDLLRTCSQNVNRKLRDIADDVVVTGELPPVWGG